MKATVKQSLFFFSVFFLFSCIAWSINVLGFHYVGNNYFPKAVDRVFFVLILSFCGSVLQFGVSHPLTERLKVLIFLFFVMFCLVLGANVAQYTPFQPIDQTLLVLHNRLSIPFDSMLSFIHQYPRVYVCLTWIYCSLSQQMTYLPLFILCFGPIERLYQYAVLLLISGLIGYTIYYFFPTRAPSSIVESAYFLSEQHATHIKFDEIHSHLPPSTLEGGMVAFPSFHVIWAYFCVFLVQDWGMLFYPLIVLNSILAIACVLLGWHYSIDVLGSLFVILVTHWITKKIT